MVRAAETEERKVSSQGLYIQALALPLKVKVLPILLPLIKQVQIPIPIPEQIQAPLAVFPPQWPARSLPIVLLLRLQTLPYAVLVVLASAGLPLQVQVSVRPPQKKPPAR